MTAELAVRFGPYILQRRIARGGMAEVFLAQQRGLEGFGRRVAVKRILPHRADAPDFIQMFLDEARLAAQLTHPNIVHIYDFGKVDGDHFIAMEYVDGVNAGDVIKRGEIERMSPAMVARIAADAAAALHYAHELRSPSGQPYGVVHRDVSPANLMVSFDGVVKLCDFGIAKAAALGERVLTHPGVVKGKYAYMSPEQTVGMPLDGRSDVYTLAIVMWELLAGRLLVPRGDPVSAMRAIRDGQITPIEEAAPWTPPPLAEAVTWALATDRDQRPDAAQLAQTLEAFIKSSPEIVTSMHIGAWLRARFSRELPERDDNTPITTQNASAPARAVPAAGTAHRPALPAPGVVPGAVIVNPSRVTGPRVVPASAAMAGSGGATGASWVGADAPAGVSGTPVPADPPPGVAALLLAASAPTAVARNGRVRVGFTVGDPPRNAAAGTALPFAAHEEAATAMLAFDNAETLPAADAPVGTAGRAARRRAGVHAGDLSSDLAAVAPDSARDVPAAAAVFDPGELSHVIGDSSDPIGSGRPSRPMFDLSELAHDTPSVALDIVDVADIVHLVPAAKSAFDSSGLLLADVITATEPTRPRTGDGGDPEADEVSHSTAREVPAARVAFDTLDTQTRHAALRAASMAGMPMLIAPARGARRGSRWQPTPPPTPVRRGGLRAWQLVLLALATFTVALLSFSLTWSMRRDADASAPAPAPPAQTSPPPPPAPEGSAAPATSLAPEPAVGPAETRAAGSAGSAEAAPVDPPPQEAAIAPPAAPAPAPDPGRTAAPPAADAGAFAALHVQTDPVGATVTVRRCRDGEPGSCVIERAAAEPPIGSCDASPCEFTLPAGAYEIVTALDGTSERRQVSLAGDMATSLDIVFRGRPATGKLNVRTPSPCKAVLDGRARGQTPLVAVELRPGTHRLELRCGRRPATTRTVTITPGKTTSVTLPR